MSIKRYGTPTKPGALPFSKAAGADGWLFVSGQVPRDADGEIVMMNAKEFILEKEYFSKYTLDAPSYKEGFVGLTGETMTDDVAFISGATVTTNAVKVATRDVFDAFATLKENGGFGNE